MKRKLILFIRRMHTLFVDILTIRYFFFCRRKDLSKKHFPFKNSITQRINPSATLSEKVTNLTLGANKISGIVIQPGQIFSFWHLIGAPILRRGFQESRSIIKGKLQKEVGGGLCQLSGIIYHLALINEMSILERHNHSKDIYEESERFTPLGSDATVVYGYKDLRFKNSKTYPLMLSIDVTVESITAGFHSMQNIKERKLQFVREDLSTKTVVNTLDAVSGEIVAYSSYGK